MTSETEDKEVKDNEEAREQARKYFIEQIAISKEKQADYDYRSRTTDQRKSPSFRAFYSGMWILYHHHIETLEILQGITDALFDINNDVMEKTQRLEKDVQAISEKIGIVPSIKMDVDALKETVGPKISAVIELLAQKREDAKKNPNEGKSIV
jgi:hypothetical protein